MVGWRTTPRLLLSTALVFALVAGLSMAAWSGTASAVTVDPTPTSGNPDCYSLGLGSYETKIKHGFEGTHNLRYGHTVTVDIVGENTFDWNATMGLDAVIVKGGPGANVYVYPQEAMNGEGLHPPKKSPREYYGLSHISFCYDFEPPTKTPTVTATATPTNTPEPTATPTDTPVPTSTPTDTPEPTATPTDTPEPTATPTDTPVPTPTPTDTPEPTATPTDTPEPTATPTDTPEPTATPTGTTVPGPTSTPTVRPSETAVPTVTPTATQPPANTPTPTNTPVPPPPPPPPPTTTPMPSPTPTPTEEPGVVILSETPEAVVLAEEPVVGLPNTGLGGMAAGAELPLAMGSLMLLGAARLLLAGRSLRRED